MSAHASAARPEERAPSPPEWFQQALARPVETGVVHSRGASIVVHRWGGAGRVTHVLVHGAGANAGWWAHVAPMLAADGNAVVAVDMSGHGASDWREAYDLDTWADELRAVVLEVSRRGEAVVVGHSLGGIVTLVAAASPGHGFAGCVLIDSFLRSRDERRQATRERIATTPTTVYPSRAAAIAQFRPFPRPARMLPYVADAVADRSLRRVEGGFTWRFDPRIFARPDIERLPAPLARTALVRPQHGLLDDHVLAVLQSRVQLAALVELPAAGHHPMLDEPLRLVEAIQSAVVVVRGHS